MAMTREEKNAKNYLIHVLRSEGYPTYAKIFQKFDFNFTNHPGIAAYLDPAKGVIVANRTLDEFQICTIIRHEILHHYLKHEKRLLDKLAIEKGLDPDDIDDMTLDEIKKELYSNSMFNYAADYEISNRGYTDKDKEIVRNLKLNGEIVQGLVTEDDHPDWVDLSVEEMYDKIREERKREEEESKMDEDDCILGTFMDEDQSAFLCPMDNTIYTDPKTAEELRRLFADAEE